MDGDVVQLDGGRGGSQEGSRRPGSREDFAVSCSCGWYNQYLCFAPFLVLFLDGFLSLSLGSVVRV